MVARYNIENNSLYNEGKSNVAERFMKTIKKQIYRFMTSISKSLYIDKVNDIVNEYSNTYHKNIKMKPVGVSSRTYFDFFIKKY